MADTVKDVSDALTELALDLRWAWNHAADQLWARLDPDRWKLTRNAWVVLQTVSRDRLRTVAADAGFRSELDRLIQKKHERDTAANWFQQAHPNPQLKAVAYFSMEFMLTDALPIYSGGLGNVAGDQLKSAGDLGVPVIGISLLYQRGYFRQHIDAQGRQQALYPYNDPGQLPIRPLRSANGEWISVVMDLPGFQLNVRVWEAQVGRARLYLLDTNDPANLPEHRGIAGELYGGDFHTRFQQEEVLGIAGWRLLRQLGINAQVCHLNEGHAAFAVLERARSYMLDTKQPFEVALEVTRAGNLFTTHTPVAAGFDRFPADFVASQFREYAEGKLGIPIQQLLGLGRMNPNDPNEPFNMAYLAFRGSGAVNGVSRLHGEVSRKIFQGLFPRWPETEVPVGYVTNGVHMSTWDSPEADELWTKACGKDRWNTDLSETEKLFRAVAPGDIWEMRNRARRRLIEFVRERLARQFASHGATSQEVESTRHLFDPDSLTIGFARRFATYKRPNLLLHDRERLLRILTNSRHPVQLIIAGKAHPQDGEGQEMIRQWIEFIRGTAARSQAVFLADYDMGVTEQLVQGVDLWLNTPRRPWEACGTSGMKVLPNGGLNFSELDGWWAEASTPDVGWAIGDGKEHNSDPAWDAAEAEQLYTILEEKVIPDFYQRDPSGLPVEWLAKIRESMARLTPAFSSNRAVREYTDNYYLPAARNFLERSAQNGKLGADLRDWQKRVADQLTHLRFDDPKVESDGKQLSFCVQAYLDEFDPESVRMELYAEGHDGTGPVRKVMTRGDRLAGTTNAYSFKATVPADRAPEEFTPRIVPYHEGAAVPLEAPEILWYR